jgi:hypothetical protein
MQALRATVAAPLLLLASISNVNASDLLDHAYLTGDRWNDGQAEIAFYEVERSLDHHGRAMPQSFLAGTYLVKHDFDRVRQSKARAGAADAISAFKWSIFYEFESGDNSDQYKYAYVVNLAQGDLTPLKSSFTSFDWCSNRYRELSFRTDGKADFLMRSDDYGNAEATIEAPEGVFPVTAVPLLVRALDFSETDEQRFALLLEDGTKVHVSAKFRGREIYRTAEGDQEVERIQLTYDGDYPSLISLRGDEEESYFRSVDSARLLLGIEAETYRMQLVEAIRSPYWAENLFPRLKRIKTRP